jgi:hypothetical protein
MDSNSPAKLSGVDDKQSAENGSERPLYGSFSSSSPGSSLGYYDEDPTAFFGFHPPYEELPMEYSYSGESYAARSQPLDYYPSNPYQDSPTFSLPTDGEHVMSDKPPTSELKHSATSGK